MAKHEAIDTPTHDAITAEVKNYLISSGVSDSALARKTNVPQTFIWHLKRGKFRKLTPRMKRVLQYIRIETRTDDVAVGGVEQAVKEFLAAGGDLAVLRSSIDMLTRAYAET